MEKFMTKEFAPTLAPPVDPHCAANVAIRDEREAFEAWAKEYGRIFTAKDDSGKYTNQWTREAWVGWQARASHAQACQTIDDLCAQIKAADDAAADRDYMLDSDDCIAVLRGEWNGVLAMDKPERPSHWQAPASKIDGLTAAQESLGVEFEKVLHDNLFDLYEESAAQQEAQTPAHIKAMERAWLWMENQADSQSKGGHATFDLMMLREERDALRAALAAASTAYPSHAAQSIESDGWLHENGLLYRLTDERYPTNRDEINVTMVDGSRSVESRSRRALELLNRIRGAEK